MNETEAARAVLLEVLNALGAMRDELVIVGGWVPDLLYPKSNHMGSLDVDLAVSPNAIGGNAYSSIRERVKTLCSFNVRHLKMRANYLDCLMRFESEVRTASDLLTRSPAI